MWQQKRAQRAIFSISLSEAHNRILHKPISGVKEQMIPAEKDNKLSLFHPQFSVLTFFQLLLFNFHFFTKAWSLVKGQLQCSLLILQSTPQHRRWCIFFLPVSFLAIFGLFTHFLVLLLLLLKQAHILGKKGTDSSSFFHSSHESHTLSLVSGLPFYILSLFT